MRTPAVIYTGRHDGLELYLPLPRTQYKPGDRLSVAVTDGLTFDCLVDHVEKKTRGRVILQPIGAPA